MELERRVIEIKGLVLDGVRDVHDHTAELDPAIQAADLEARAAIGKAGKSGSVAGYGSVFGNLDSYGDVILPGAFAKTLQSFIDEGALLWGHEWGGQPIATVKAAREDATGLWVEGEFHSTDYAQECRSIARERIERGKRMGLSIGFRTAPGGSEWSEDGNFRVLKDLILYEISLVLMPANPKAMAESVKSFQDHADAVLAAADGILRRSRALAELRAKDGRTISQESRAKLVSLHDSLTELVALTDGQVRSGDPAGQEDAEMRAAEARRLQAEFLQIDAGLIAA